MNGIGYGPAGELKGISYLGYTENRTYNNLLQLTRLTTAGTRGNDFQYNFSAAQNNGKITSQQDMISGEQVTYTYDALLRLTSAVTIDNPNVTQWGQSYSYDGFGSLTDVNVIKGSAPSMHIVPDPTTNRIQGVSYDANGNDLSQGSYDVANHFAQAGAALYAYAPDGKRVWKAPDGNSAHEEVYFWSPQGQRLGTYKLNATATGNSAVFVKTDTSTQGTWKGLYGTGGYNVIDDTASYPSYVTVTPSGQSNYIWSGSTSDVRALQKASSATDRIAATWYSSGSFTIDLNFSDTAPHQVAVYCLDWDNGGPRSQTVSVLDGATQAVLDSRAVSNFFNGQYLVWTLSGHVILRVTNTGPGNAVVSGLFFDSAMASTNIYFGGRPIAAQGNAVRMDRLGSNVSGGRRYYPYGQERPSATTNNLEKFTGYFRDAETGLDYADQRYHQPGMGRFTTPDPYKGASGGPGDPANPGSWNRYAYVVGDPINWIDSLGLDYTIPPGGTFNPANPGNVAPGSTSITVYGGTSPGPSVNSGATFANFGFFSGGQSQQLQANDDNHELAMEHGYQAHCPAGQQYINATGSCETPVACPIGQQLIDGQCDTPLSDDAKAVLGAMIGSPLLGPLFLQLPAPTVYSATFCQALNSPQRRRRSPWP